MRDTIFLKHLTFYSKTKSGPVVPGAGCSQQGLATNRRRSSLPRYTGGYGSHGLNTGTCALSKSLRSRVTTVKPWCRAVAAITRSGCE